jgi:hypothetical protein
MFRTIYEKNVCVCINPGNSRPLCVRISSSMSEANEVSVTPVQLIRAGVSSWAYEQFARSHLAA